MEKIMPALKKYDERAKQLDIIPKYDVYIFHPQKQAGMRLDWEWRHTTPCIKQARQHAEELMQTNAYPKVEIRKKYFDRYRARQVDCAVKIYGTKADRKKWLRIALVAAVMFMSGMFLFLKS